MAIKLVTISQLLIEFGENIIKKSDEDNGEDMKEYIQTQALVTGQKIRAMFLDLFKL